MSLAVFQKKWCKLSNKSKRVSGLTSAKAQQVDLEITAAVNYKHVLTCLN